MTDEEAMRLALAEAQRAADAGEVPVGAVVVQAGRVVGVGRNAPIGSHDPSAHAEIVALRAAARTLGNYRLDGCELFVTLEPCAMCSGAMLHARLGRVVYGAADAKTGAAGSVVDLFAQPALNHHTRVQGGVLAEQGAALLQAFFQQRRLRGNARLPLREDALRTPAERFAGFADAAWPSKLTTSLPSLDGLVLHYRDTGARTDAATPTLLCIHGRHGWSQHYAALRPAWQAAGCRVLAVDLIGFGMSDKPKREATHQPEWHRHILRELIDTLDLRDVVLVLQGTGGLLALELPRHEAWRYNGLVALDPVCRSAIVQRQEASDWPPGWERVEAEQVVVQLRNEGQAGSGLADLAPFPDAGHRAGPRAFARFVHPSCGAPPWPAAEVPAGEGGGPLARRMLDAFAMGYSRA